MADSTGAEGVHARRPVIGPASEFYRLRLTSVDITGAPHFEWRDDVLYRSPSDDIPQEQVEWAVEAVPTDGDDSVIELRRLDTYEAAREFLLHAEEVLRELTKSQFEEHFSDTS